VANQTQLEITWSGPLSSLERHTVSLTAFAEPLCHLLTAARRIASNMVSDALEPAETGRLAKEAHQIDIEIGSIRDGSSGVSAIMTYDPPNLNGQQPLFNSLTENVGIALLDSIESESQGFLKNSAVRKYLHSLPLLLTRQHYNLHENGRPIKEITVGMMRLPELPEEPPFLTEIVGRIIGVGFEPGRPEIRLKSEDGAHATVPATAKQVEKALDHRTALVRVLILKNGAKTRLLRMEDTSVVRFRPDPEKYLFEKWGKLLQRLAQ
jgi:hypothetical protein